MVRILGLGMQLSRAALVAPVHIGLVSSPVSPTQNNLLQQRGSTTDPQIKPGGRRGPDSV